MANGSLKHSTLIISVILHVFVIGLLFVEMPTTTYRLPNPQAKQAEQPKPVQAVAVNQREVMQQVEAIKHHEQQKERRRQAKLRRLQQAATAAKRAREREQQHLAKLRHAREVEQKRLQRQRQLAEKRRKQRKAAEAKRKRELLARRKALQQRLLQQQLSSEKKQLTHAQTVALRGAIDRYKAAILQAIKPYWLIPDSANARQTVVYLIILGDKGQVRSVRLVRSSGNTALDRSARTAIMRASPLPIPKDPTLFDKFQELRLTLSPKQIL